MFEFMKKVGKSDIRNILAVIIVIGCFALLYLLQVKEIPVGNKDVLNIAIGFVFGGVLANVGGYYFGSSKDQDKGKKQDSDL
jgi:hypothetical protein